MHDGRADARLGNRTLLARPTLGRKRCGKLEICITKKQKVETYIHGRGGENEDQDGALHDGEREATESELSGENLSSLATISTRWLRITRTLWAEQLMHSACILEYGL